MRVKVGFNHEMEDKSQSFIIYKEECARIPTESQGQM